MIKLETERGSMRQCRMMLTAAVAAAMFVGCQRQVNVPRGEMATSPIEPDEAMQIRDWSASAAYYQNPRFIAGPTGHLFETPYEPTQWYYAASDTALFLGQTLGIPIVLIMNPPWTPVEYAGETLPPTYHAMPPLPPPGGATQEMLYPEPEPAPEPAETVYDSAHDLPPVTEPEPQPMPVPADPN